MSILDEILECAGTIVKNVNTTQDIDADSIKDEAAKFCNDVTKEGVPVSNYTDYIFGLTKPKNKN